MMSSVRYCPGWILSEKMVLVIGILRWLTLAFWVFWLAVYWNFGRKIWQDIQAANSRWDAFLMNAIGLGGLVISLTGLAITLGWDAAQPWRDNWPVALSGALVTMIGMLGTFYCRRYLGRLWTAEAALQDAHQIVDTGPYGLVRHPIYTAVIVMYAGTALIFSTWWVWLSFAVVAGAYALKSRFEDDFLGRELAGYEAYRERVRYRLIPGIW